MYNQKNVDMYYKYDKKKMQYVKIDFIRKVVLLISIVSAGLVIFGMTAKTTIDFEDISETEIKLILLKEQEFTKEKLIDKIKALNFKYPHIVYAQALLESNHFKSKMFVENNNLFGMKEAKVRINTSKGTNNSHAYYDNWVESLYDYALYSSRYLSTVSNEAEYFQYLGQYYAEDKEYTNKLKKIIQRDKLTELFAKN